MRYCGGEFDGDGVTVAVIDSGVDTMDPRLAGTEVLGWNITLGATGHALIGADSTDVHGHGTVMAAALTAIAPRVKVLSIRIMDEHLRTTADLMAAGIETAFRNGARVISMSMGTPNMGKALLLRDACALASEARAVVLAAAHPRGERAYPADLPETVGVAAHPDCPVEKFFWFDPLRFERADWSNLSGKFLAHGHDSGGAEGSGFRGSGIATATLAGYMACIAQARPDASAPDLIHALAERAQIPIPDMGYAS
jgi:subtilisin family serine protease